MSSIKPHSCLVCGNITRNRITCSKECSSKRFAKPLVKCLQCSEIIPKNFENKKFCNHSCAASYNNKGRVRNPLGNGGFTAENTGGGNNGGGRKYTEKYCLFCNGRISSTLTYCSNKCFNDFRQKSKIEAWLGKPSLATNKHGQIPVYIRKYLLEEANNRCTSPNCSTDDFDGIILEIDHIDGDAHNNVRNNLRVLCPQCHALSPFHRALNRKSSRVNRKR